MKVVLGFVLKYFWKANGKHISGDNKSSICSWQWYYFQSMEKCASSIKFNWWNFSTIDPISKFFIVQLSKIQQLVTNNPVVKLDPVQMFPGNTLAQPIFPRLLCSWKHISLHSRGHAIWCHRLHRIFLGIFVTHYYVHTYCYCLMLYLQNTFQ